MASARELNDVAFRSEFSSRDEMGDQWPPTVVHPKSSFPSDGDRGAQWGVILDPVAGQAYLRSIAELPRFIPKESRRVATTLRNVLRGGLGSRLRSRGAQVLGTSGTKEFLFPPRITYQGGKMQSVVRSSLLGLLAMAALAACGDKVTPNDPNNEKVVHSVTVTPNTVPNLAVGAKIILTASVDADQGVTDRTVAWSSSDATVASVNATTGEVTGVKAGTVTITAKATANPSVAGSALVTVGGGGGNASISIGQINNTVCVAGGACTSIPATLSNVHDQLDVTLNVDAAGQTINGLDLIMNCGGADTVVATQPFASANVANVAAEEAAAPVTMSFNTAAFTAATGAPAFKNGACTLKARARLASGSQIATSGTPITLNNIDFVSTTITTTPSTGQNASATDASGLLWRAGAVNVTAVPVIYTANRTIASAAVTLVNAGGDAALGRSSAVVPNGGTVAVQSGLTPAAGVITASFANNTTAPTGVSGATVDTLGVLVTTVDNNGNAGPTLAASSANFIRLDNRAPDVTTVAPTFVANTQHTLNGWVGKNFVFSTDAGSLTISSVTTRDSSTVVGALNVIGVDRNTVSTQFAPQGASSTSTSWATFTSASSLTETAAATGTAAYDLRLRICDALGNCNNSATLTTFGVDLTAPTAATVSSPKANEIVGIGQTLSNANSITVNAVDPQGANGVSGSGIGATPVQVQATRLAPSGTSGQATTCVIGTPNTGNTACTASVDSGKTFLVPTTNPGQYQVIYQVSDQAGNQSSTVTLNYYIDQNAPTASGGIAIPASITAGAAFTSSVADNMDLASAQGVLHYPLSTGAVNIVAPATLSATGVAFDNTLTRAATASFTLSAQQFYRSLGGITGGAITAVQVKPDLVGIRALDAANNLSAQNQASLPAANIANSTAFTVPGSMQDFRVVSDQASVSNGTGTTPRSTTLHGIVTAASLTSSTPFSSVCFYIQSPTGAENGQADPVTHNAAGDLSLLGCTSTLVTTDVAGVRSFDYAMSFDPDAAFGTSGSLNIVAIGVSSAGDALLTLTPAPLGLVP